MAFPRPSADLLPPCAGIGIDRDISELMLNHKRKGGGGVDDKN